MGTPTGQVMSEIHAKARWKRCKLDMKSHADSAKREKKLAYALGGTKLP